MYLKQALCQIYVHLVGKVPSKLAQFIVDPSNKTKGNSWLQDLCSSDKEDRRKTGWITDEEVNLNHPEMALTFILHIPIIIIFERTNIASKSVFYSATPALIFLHSGKVTVHGLQWIFKLTSMKLFKNFWRT